MTEPSNSPQVCGLAAPFKSLPGYELLPTIVGLIARGSPVEVGEIASAAGRGIDVVESVLHSVGGTEWDEQGRLVGLGLTLRPTRHRFIVEGTTLYTWCASDTFLLAPILGTRALVESTCPVSGTEIRIELAPTELVRVSPASTVVSERDGAGMVADLREQVCEEGNFFASPEAASGWLASHDDGEILSVAKAFERCQATCAELGWIKQAPEQP